LYTRHNLSCIYTLLIFSLSTFPSFFLFNYTATTEIYTLSLHDALPISRTHKLILKCLVEVIEVRRLPLVTLIFGTLLKTEVLLVVAVFTIYVLSMPTYKDRELVTD